MDVKGFAGGKMFNTVFAIAAGLIALFGLMYSVSKVASLKNTNTLKSKNGDYVLPGWSKTFQLILCCFGVTIFGSIMLLTFGKAVGDFVSPIIIVTSFSTMTGVLLVAISICNRIEYNERNIRQYMLFAKEPATILWEDIIHLEFNQFMNHFVIRSESERIDIDMHIRESHEIIRLAKSALKRKEATEHEVPG
jgi:hypothetical protein